MKKITKFLLIIFLAALLVLFFKIASAGTCLFPSSGGTGKCTAVSGDVGKFLKVSSSSPLIYTFDTAGSTSPLTTKGDLYTYSTADARLPIGSNGKILSADSTQTTGLKWIDAPSTTLAAVSSASLTTPNSLYTMTSSVPVEFKTSGGTSAWKIDDTAGLSTNLAYAKFGNASPFIAATTGLEVWGNDNTTSGVQLVIGNRNSGHSAYNSLVFNNDLASDGLLDHFGAVVQNSSTYSDTTFGTAFAVPNLIALQNTDADLAYMAVSNTGAHIWYVGNTVVGGIATVNTTNELMRLTSTGLGIGGITPLSKLNVVDTSSSAIRGVTAQQISSDTASSRVNCLKARGTYASQTTVVTGDILCNLAAWGYDGSNYLNMGSIQVGSSGTIASTRVPTYMAFSTATNATPSVLTERMRIDNAGLVGIGTTSPAFKLDVNGVGNFISADATFVGSRVYSSDSSHGAGYEMGITGISSGFDHWLFEIRPSAVFGGEAKGWYVLGVNHDGSLSTAPLMLGPTGNVLLAAGTSGSNGKVGIGTASPTNILSIAGQANQKFWLERNTTSNTAGNSLTIQSGGATSAATDKNGGQLIETPGVSTGTGFNSVRLQSLTRATTTGTSDNTLEDRLIIPSVANLTNNSAIGLFDVSLTAGSTAGGFIDYTITASDGTDFHSITGTMEYDAVNKAGVYTTQFTPTVNTVASSNIGGTNVPTWSLVTGTNKFTVTMNDLDSLTTTTLQIRYVLHNNSGSSITQL